MKITKEQKQETMDLILMHSRNAFLEEDYEKVKLSTISKACHIAEGTLYNYFKDKPTLFIATFIRYRSDNDQVFTIYPPKDFEEFIDEIIEILSFYMKIDNPILEKSFKRFLHLVREQKLVSENNMEQALLIADEYIYRGVLELLNLCILDQVDCNLLFHVMEKQVEGVFNDYLYNDIDFDTFLSVLRENLTVILKPYVRV